MSRSIPRAFVDELLLKLDIVEVIGEYVPLKKMGQNYTTCCPFHDEKTPSFSVNQTKQMFYCFGCSVGGNVITFVMRFLSLDFPESVEKLASLAGVSIPENTSEHHERRQYRENLYKLMERVLRFYVAQREKHPAAKNIAHYLTERGVDSEIARHYELGFAPPGREHISTRFAQNPEILQQLLHLNVIAKGKNGYYDYFTDRLMFPIRDSRGRVVGFGGRVIDQHKQPKYLNSSQSDIFHKGRELYGLYQLKQAHRSVTALFIVEGYMDVLALVQHGISNVVACLGTAITRDHIHQLFRVCNNLIFCFDGDNAGKKAAWLTLEKALPLLHDDRQINFLFLPDGEDPDSFIRKNSKAQFIDPALQLPLSVFFFEHLSSHVDLKISEGRAAMSKRAINYLKEMPKITLRDLLINELAKITQLTIEQIYSQLEGKSQATTKQISKFDSVGLRPKRQNYYLSKVDFLLCCLLNDPQCALGLGEILDSDEFPEDINFLCDIVKFIIKNNDVSSAVIFEHYRDTKYAERLNQLIAKVEKNTDEAEKYDDPKTYTQEQFISNFNSLMKKYQQQHRLEQQIACWNQNQSAKDI